MGIRFGIFPRSVYKVHNNTRPEAIYTWDDMFTRRNEGKPERVAAPMPGEAPSPIDLQYKVKTDEMTREDFNLIKHVGTDYFAMPVSLGALALAFRIHVQLDGGPSVVWHTLGIVSAVVFVLLLVLYIAKIVFYRRKVLPG